MMKAMTETLWPWILGIVVLLTLGWLASQAVAAAPPALQVTSPSDYQVVQRTRRHEGTLRITGQLAKASAAGDVVEAQWTGDGAPGTWHRLLSLDPGQTRFEAELVVPAGGWYRLGVRVKRIDEVLAEGQVAHVGVGEVFLVAGQSNSANHGEEKQTVTSGRVAAFTGDGWQIADDPQPGASGSGGSFIPPFADALVRRFNVPVGVVAVGSGGTSVREWLPQGTRFPQPPTSTGNVRRVNSSEWESNGKLFDNLVSRMQTLGAHGFRAVVWHQGESDANQRDTNRTLPGERYRVFMEQVIRESRQAAGWEAPWWVAQVSYHTPDDPGSPDIRAAQASLWKSGIALEGPDTDALTGPMRDSGGQGVHFSGPGLREHARLWVEKVGPWLDQVLADGRPN